MASEHPDVVAVLETAESTILDTPGATFADGTTKVLTNRLRINIAAALLRARADEAKRAGTWEEQRATGAWREAAGEFYRRAAHLRQLADQLEKEGT